MLYFRLKWGLVVHCVVSNWWSAFVIGNILKWHIDVIQILTMGLINDFDSMKISTNKKRFLVIRLLQIFAIQTLDARWASRHLKPLAVFISTICYGLHARNINVPQHWPFLKGIHPYSIGGFREKVFLRDPGQQVRTKLTSILPMYLRQQSVAILKLHFIKTSVLLIHDWLLN